MNCRSKRLRGRACPPRKEIRLQDKASGNSDPILSSLTNCRLCPRECGINRLAGERGVCGMGADITAARAALHFWEEPCISGTKGSGTVFFSGCSLHCSFCQNEPISRGRTGKSISAGRLCGIFFELKAKGAHNINLVTPTHFIPQITEALRMAKEKGLGLPVVCNCGGYESVEALRIWDGLIDIYLPDMKFYSGTLSKSICTAPDYFGKASAALAEMFRQTGEPVIDENGLMKKGMIVRHLMLPGHLFDTRKILAYLCSTYGNKIYISLMNQYTPPAGTATDTAHPGTPAHPSGTAHPSAPDHPLREDHYEAMIQFLADHDQVNAYTQERGTVSESFIPPFDLTGI